VQISKIKNHITNTEILKGLFSLNAYKMDVLFLKTSKNFK